MALATADPPSPFGPSIDPPKAGPKPDLFKQNSPTMKIILLLSLLTAAFIARGGYAAAETATLTVQADKPGAQINPAMWGIFFEDINFGADGGLYAELVKNRGFEFPEPMMGWTTLSPGIAKGRVSVQNERPFNESNSRYLRVESEGNGLFGVANEGFRGMGVRQNETYHFSMRARVGAGSPAVRVELYSSQGALLDTATLKN